MAKMTDIDLTLSEIISKKKITLQRSKSAGVVKAKPVIKKPPQVLMNMKTSAQFETKPLGDARNHIIQRKRLNLTDARDQLAKLAKTGDARDRLNLKRGSDGAVIKKNTGGIPALMEELQSKPVDMRQKLNLKRTGSLQTKNFSNAQQQISGQQANRVSMAGQTRMQGNALVRTVSTNNSAAAKRPRLSNNFVNQNGSSAPVQRQFANTNVQQRQYNGQPIRPQQVVTVRAPPAVVHTSRPVQMARRRVGVAGAPMYAQPRPRQTVVTQAPHQLYSRGPVPLMPTPRSAGARLGPQAARPVLVSRGSYRQQQPATVVYEQQPEVVYQDEPLEYDEYDGMPEVELPQEVYCEEERSPSPYYQEPEYAEEVYVPRSMPVHHQPQQQYGPPAPQPRQQHYNTMGSYASRPQLRQQQQHRVVPQRPSVQQPQRITMQQQQQQRVQVQQQQRAQVQQQRVPLQQRAPLQQRQPVQQRQQPRLQQQPQQAIRRSVPAPRPVPVTPKIVGHKVMVSNLHPVATHEDIEELFGNIGPISSCKMARPGSASVIFLNLSDAHKSVEVYHNRKLDGQPMQVKILGSITDSGSIVSTTTTTPSRNVRMRGSY